PARLISLDLCEEGYATMRCQRDLLLKPDASWIWRAPTSWGFEKNRAERKLATGPPIGDRSAACVGEFKGSQDVFALACSLSQLVRVTPKRERARGQRYVGLCRNQRIARSRQNHKDATRNEFGFLRVHIP